MACLKKNLPIVASLFVLAAVVFGQANSASAKQRLEIMFEKFVQDDQGVLWVGTGLMEVDGELVDVDVAALWPLPSGGRPQIGRILPVTEFRFCIYEADTFDEEDEEETVTEKPDDPILAIDLVGIINTANGKIRFRGKVVESEMEMVPAGSKAKLRSVASEDFSSTMGSVFVKLP